MKFKSRHIVFWFVLLAFVSLWEKTYAHEVKYLKKDWLVYDEASKQLYPYVNDNKKSLPLHVFVSTKGYAGLSISVKTSENIAIYANSKFFHECLGDSQCILSIDSLAKVAGAENVLLSFYGKFNKRLLDSLAIVNPVNIAQESISGIQHVALTKTQDWDKSYFAIFLLVVALLFAMVRTSYYKVFPQFYDLGDLLWGNKSETSQVKVSFEGHYVTFAMVGAIFFALATTSFPVFVDRADASFSSFLFGFLYLIMLAIFFYLLKYIVTASMAWLFSVGKYSMLHYKLFIKTSVVWSSALLLLALVKYSEVVFLQPLLLPTFMVLSFFFLTLTSIKVSFLINRVARVSTLYLISYLCITEWLPYFVILKLYMVYFY